MATENPGLTIFNNWITSFNHIHKFTKDSKYDDILYTMFPSIESKKQALVLNSFKEKKLISDSTVRDLEELIQQTRERLTKKELKEYEEVRRKKIQLKDNKRRKIEINGKYKFFIDLSAREIEYFVEDEHYRAIRLIIVKTFVGEINEKIGVDYLERKCPKLRRIGVRKIIVFLECIKDHPRRFELLQALRPVFKYICNIEDEIKARIVYVN